MIVKIKVSNIRKILASRNLKYAWLAEKTGLSTSHIYKILEGHADAGCEARQRIRICFNNIPWDDLFFIEGE